MHKVWLAVAAGWMMLAGCAAPDATQVSDSDAAGKGAAQAAAPASPVAPQPAVPAVSVESPAPVESPVTIAFEERSTELDGTQRELIARIAAQAGQSAQFVLTGQADRSAIANGREVAIARAVAVREALKQAGVKSKRFRIKYTTAQARHGVIVQWTE